MKKITRRLAVAVLLAAGVCTGQVTMAQTSPSQNPPSAQGSQNKTGHKSDTWNKTGMHHDKAGMKDASMRMMDDASFLKKAYEGGMAEIELGRLAEEKASSDKVKSYGRLMVDDHTMANQMISSMFTGKGGADAMANGTSGTGVDNSTNAAGTGSGTGTGTGAGSMGTGTGTDAGAGVGATGNASSNSAKSGSMNAGNSSSSANNDGSMNSSSNSSANNGSSSGNAGSMNSGNNSSSNANANSSMNSGSNSSSNNSSSTGNVGSINSDNATNQATTPPMTSDSNANTGTGSDANAVGTGNAAMDNDAGVMVSPELKAQESSILATELSAEHKALKQKLSGLSGAAFDKAYLQAMVKDHTKMLGMVEAKAKEDKDASASASPARDWAKQHESAIRQHKEKAEKLLNNEMKDSKGNK